MKKSSPKTPKSSSDAKDKEKLKKPSSAKKITSSNKTPKTATTIKSKPAKKETSAQSAAAKKLKPAKEGYKPESPHDTRKKSAASIRGVSSGENKLPRKETVATPTTTTSQVEGSKLPVATPPAPTPKKKVVSLKNNLSAAIHELETGPAASVAVKKSTPRKSSLAPAASKRAGRDFAKPAESRTIPSHKEEKPSDLHIKKEGDLRPADAGIIDQKPSESPAHTQPATPVRPKLSITISEFDTVRDFAAKIGVSPVEVVKKALESGSVITINQRIDRVIAELIAADYNCEVKFISVSEDKSHEGVAGGARTRGSVPRPPVVTVMGHVDHGKTTLLDTIRHSSVALGEHGGITQHIGAYRVKTPKGDVAFLDTPGHEAFTALRARGSKITDIVVLVVSAVDGVMPQTIEAINHARAAGVPIIVAINKIDIQGANPDKIKSELNQYKLTPEEWGGDTLMVEISARNNINIDKLLEAIHLQAEMLELKCDPSASAVGAVVESKLDPRRGPLVTLLVRNGTLKVGDVFVAGSAYGKVRAMFDEYGKNIRVAEPSTPALVLGAAELPSPGDSFYIVLNEREARDITERIKTAIKNSRQGGVVAGAALSSLMTLPTSVAAADSQSKEEKILRLILKADVAGSLEAIRDHIERIEHPEFKIQIIHAGIGQVSESDINLARTTGSVIICFNVKADSANQALAERYKVDIRTYRIVYELFSDIKKALEGLLEPKLEETVTGRATVRKKFVVTRVGAVAGSYVSEGKITRGSKARILRDGVIVYEGKIASLRRIKEDVNSVDKGYECGITLENFEDIKENDIIEAYTVEKVKRLL